MSRLRRTESPVKSASKRSLPLPGFEALIESPSSSDADRVTPGARAAASPSSSSSSVGRGSLDTSPDTAPVPERVPRPRALERWTTVDGLEVERVGWSASADVAGGLLVCWGCGQAAEYSCVGRYAARLAYVAGLECLCTLGRGLRSSSSSSRSLAPLWLQARVKRETTSRVASGVARATDRQRAESGQEAQEGTGAVSRAPVGAQGLGPAGPRKASRASGRE